MEYITNYILVSYCISMIVTASVFPFPTFILMQDNHFEQFCFPVQNCLVSQQQQMWGVFALLSGDSPMNNRVWGNIRAWHCQILCLYSLALGNIFIWAKKIPLFSLSSPLKLSVWITLHTEASVLLRNSALAPLCSIHR